MTRKLHLALKRLRHGGSGKYRCLWIDSLCIDQSNGIERNHQVSHMGRIYRNAQRVLVWLGVHSSDSEQAIHFVKMCLIVLDSRNPGRFLDMCMMVAEYKNLRSGMPSTRCSVETTGREHGSYRRFSLPRMPLFIVGTRNLTGRLGEHSSISCKEIAIDIWKQILKVSLSCRLPRSNSWRLRLYFRNGI